VGVHLELSAKALNWVQLATLLRFYGVGQFGLTLYEHWLWRWLVAELTLRISFGVACVEAVQVILFLGLSALGNCKIPNKVLVLKWCSQCTWSYSWWVLMRHLLWRVGLSAQLMVKRLQVGDVSWREHDRVIVLSVGVLNLCLGCRKRHEGLYRVLRKDPVLRGLVFSFRDKCCRFCCHYRLSCLSDFLCCFSFGKHLWPAPFILA